MVQTMSVLEFNIEDALVEVAKRGAETIGISLPTGLKRRIFDFVHPFEEIGCKVVVSGKPCHGGCDIDVELLERVDVLVHVGHSKVVPVENVIYIEPRSNVDVKGCVEESAKHLKGSRIALTTILQYVHKIDEVVSILKNKGFELLVSSGDTRISHKGQVLGCNFSAVDKACDEVLYVGEGGFHPLGIALATGKRVVVADPYFGVRVIDTQETEKLIRKRYGMIWKSMDAETFGIIHCTKVGQTRPKVVNYIHNLCEKCGKKCVVISVDEVSEEIEDFGLDAYVMCGCPRVAIDDSERFSAPMLTPQEFEIVMGLRKEYELDEIRG